MANYVLLQEVTLGASASSVTFNNLPATGYTDLEILCSTRTNSGGDYAQLTWAFNGQTTGFNVKIMQGTGSSVPAYSGTTNELGIINGNTATANTYATSKFYLPNYSVAGIEKAFIIDTAQENNNTTAYMQLDAGLCSITSAINTITITPASGAVFLAGCTFSLYGIAKYGTDTPTAKAYGGDTIVSDGTYWYHAFLNSGTFTPTQSLTCDVLVVAGGGGGISGYGGGGGAGGLLVQTGRSITTDSYSVVIGAGGAGANGANASFSGSNTTFNGITALGGGAGSSGAVGINGGSGGGGGMAANGAPGYAGGSATQGNSSGATGYGYAGGAGLRNDAGAQYMGGGGGGAGGIGATAVAYTTGAAGGVGFYNSLTTAMGAATATGVLSSSNRYYAGGGASNGGRGYNGGTGGTGGGGRGSDGDADNATVGTANTGGGGGGGWEAVGGGKAGGSGIVIVRYAV